MLIFEVDDHGLISALERAGHTVDDLVEQVARDFERTIRTEAGQVSHRLAEPWDISASGTEAHVTAPEWWAHILAHGARPHGPTTKPLLVFEVDGQTVHARFVKGVTATHFDEHAIDKTKSRVDSIMRRLIEEAT